MSYDSPLYSITTWRHGLYLPKPSPPLFALNARPRRRQPPAGAALLLLLPVAHPPPALDVLVDHALHGVAGRVPGGHGQVRERAAGVAPLLEAARHPPLQRRALVVEAVLRDDGVDEEPHGDGAVGVGV